MKPKKNRLIIAAEEAAAMVKDSVTMNLKKQAYREYMRGYMQKWRARKKAEREAK